MCVWLLIIESTKEGPLWHFPGSFMRARIFARIFDSYILKQKTNISLCIQGNYTRSIYRKKVRKLVELVSKVGRQRSTISSAVPQHEKQLSKIGRESFRTFPAWTALLQQRPESQNYGKNHGGSPWLQFADQLVKVVTRVVWVISLTFWTVVCIYELAAISSLPLVVSRSQSLAALSIVFS